VTVTFGVESYADLALLTAVQDLHIILTPVLPGCVTLRKFWLMNTKFMDAVLYAEFTCVETTTTHYYNFSFFSFCYLTTSVSGLYTVSGRAIAVSRWLPTAAARVQTRVWSSGICGGQSGTGAGFLRVLRFPLPIFIPPNSPSS
jgi:hypothetical protein